MRTRRLFWFNKVILVIVAMTIVFQFTMEMGPYRNSLSYFTSALILLCSGLELVRLELEDLRRARGAKDEAEIR